MKKYQHILATILLLLGMIGSGCQKYLDLKSDKKLLTPRGLQDAQALLDDADRMNLRVTPGYMEGAADDFFLTPTALAPLGAIGQELYQWNSVAYRFQNDWSLGYQAIYNSNLAIDMLADIQRSGVNAALYDNVMGSALFYRAYYESLLLAQHGLAYDTEASETDLGIVLRRSSDFNIPSFRSTVAECYRAIISALNEAIPMLPEHPQHVYRPSKAAAHALLARTHLYMRNYVAALTHTEKAMAIKSVLMDYNSDPDINSLSAAVPFRPLNKEVIFYTEMYSGAGLQAPNRATVNTALYASYHPDDLRRSAFFLANGANQRFKGSYAAHAITLFSGIATDELHLNEAECLVQLDRVPEGLAILDSLLRKRWKHTVPYSPITAGSRGEAIEKVRLERRKTLLMRGLRWMDIKRWNKENGAITPSRTVGGQTYILEPNSRKYALPLPEDIIQTTGMPQN